jgi:hypothetical protein
LHMVGIEEKYKFDSYIESMDWEKWAVLIIRGLRHEKEDDDTKTKTLSDNLPYIASLKNLP